MKLTVGKYTIIKDDSRFVALQDGKEWRNLVGDPFVFALVKEIEELQAFAERCYQAETDRDVWRTLAMERGG